MEHNPVKVQSGAYPRLEHIDFPDGEHYTRWYCIVRNPQADTDVVEEKEYLSFKNRTIWIYPNPETVRKVDAAAHHESKPGHVARFFARLKFWHTKVEDECEIPSFLRHQAN